jgi:hypothetical protein
MIWYIWRWCLYLTLSSGATSPPNLQQQNTSLGLQGLALLEAQFYNTTLTASNSRWLELNSLFIHSDEQQRKLEEHQKRWNYFIHWPAICSPVSDSKLFSMSWWKEEEAENFICSIWFIGFPNEAPFKNSYYVMLWDSSTCLTMVFPMYFPTLQPVLLYRSCG